ncbi:hypothetical protein EXU57_17090 [Segetibacter sp. 3557_3]|uniref:hypothetical protein n=1 Tax=Segetibacter sp. 3557_3 TaxID=2547429 RepID=UPI001058BC0D|nr:hypothetical protein [Segetibacter sp. 3557_3]TDH23517.1 hypothetical protein EXU57_17090 [Segetibacter sp. 3557_3]
MNISDTIAGGDLPVHVVNINQVDVHKGRDQLHSTIKPNAFAWLSFNVHNIADQVFTYPGCTIIPIGSLREHIFRLAVERFAKVIILLQEHHGRAENYPKGHSFFVDQVWCLSLINSR